MFSRGEHGLLYVREYGLLYVIEYYYIFESMDYCYIFETMDYYMFEAMDWLVKRGSQKRNGRPSVGCRHVLRCMLSR